jgi:hypothetical protein
VELQLENIRGIESKHTHQPIAILNLFLFIYV